MMVIISTLAIGAGGCKGKEDKQRNRTLKGTVDSIDVATKTVTMNWFNDKIGKSMIIAGKVTPETEIYIDGKLSDLGQVRSGDEVIVEGYKKGTDVVAVKVSITHAGEQSIKIGKPTAPTQPAK